jgi:mutator protein MutT
LTASKLIHVVAAAVIDAQGRVLIAQRPKGTHMAGSWEFPGGKMESGEERRQALARELREELGIAISDPRPLIRLRHAYPHKEVFLDIWVVRQYQGEPHGLEGQAVRWCTQAELETVELLPADGPIVAALRLPERLTERETQDYVVGESAEPDAKGRLRGVLCAGLSDAMAASDAGANFVVLKRGLPRAELKPLCELIPIPVYAPGLALEEAWGLGASGINNLRKSEDLNARSDL